MSYTFPFMTDEELNAVDIVPDGVYNFEILSATRQISKNGNAMCKLHIKFWDQNGQSRTIFDYLVFSNVKMNIRKVKHFCDTVGLKDDYAKGNIPEELAAYCGQFELRTEPEQPKPTGGFYPIKNVVADYVSGEVEKELPKPGVFKSDVKSDFDDDIPF